MNASLAPHRLRPIAPLEAVHSARQPRTLQFELLHQLPHCNVLLRIYGSIWLMVKEIHKDLQGAAGFILRGRSRG